MGQERLQSLVLMSVESDILKSLDLELLVKDFADMAPRKMDLVIYMYMLCLQYYIELISIKQYQMY